jgi:hypothetical protein
MGVRNELDDQRFRQCDGRRLKMAKTKAKAKKAQVKVRDLKPKKDAKGGRTRLRVQ